MIVLVIPDIHLKTRMFDIASEIMRSGAAERAVSLMDIPDDWGHEADLGLYEDTFDAAIRFQREFPETLWCFGNHDLSYLWMQPESGFSPAAASLVNAKLAELERALPDGGQMAYVHRMDRVLFVHGGITAGFVKSSAADADYGDADAVIEKINGLGMLHMWKENSPIWFRPQFFDEEMYMADELLQVVGHTPVRQIERKGNVLSCDLFSTYRNGDPIGTREFLLLDTETWDHRGII